METTELADLAPCPPNSADINVTSDVSVRNSAIEVFAFEDSVATEPNGFELNCSWFEYYKTYFDFTNSIFIAPFRFKKCLHRNLLFHSNILQGSVCALLQLLSWLYIRSMILRQWEFVQSTTDKSSYIDMLFVILISCYGLAKIINLWFNQEAFRDLVSEMNETPILTIKSSLAPIMVKVMMFAIYGVYILVSLCFLSVMMDIDVTEPTHFLTKLEEHAQITLFLTPESMNSTYGYFLTAFAAFVTVYTSFLWHYSDVFVLTSTMCMYHVARDFFNAIKHGQIPQSEVLWYYDAYLRLIKKYNNAAGVFVTLFYPFLLPYYSTHFVDMLNDSDYRNRFSMVVYLTHLGVCLVFGAKINQMGKTMKNWIRKNKAFTYRELSEQRLSLILNDLKCGRIGICGLYTVTMGFVGQVVALNLTLTIITIQFKIKLNQ